MAVKKKAVAKKKSPTTSKKSSASAVSKSKPSTKRTTKAATSKGYILAAPWPDKAKNYNTRYGLWFRLKQTIDVPNNRVWHSAKDAERLHAPIVGTGMWVVFECAIQRVTMDTTTLTPTKKVAEFNSVKRGGRG